MDLSEVQLAELRWDLENLVGELREALDGSAGAARPVELDQTAMGRVSRIDAIQQQKMLEANRYAQQSRLQLARSALLRFEDEEYGDCAACGECIGHARLKACPETLFCIGCQQARERT
jgi:DnaK suppressor protein